MSDDRLKQLQARLGYVFRDPGLLTAALTHKSYLNESKDKALGNNERLEFLGDAVLDLAVSEHLITLYPRWTEGDLSKMKARLVSEETLAGVARRLDIGSCLQLGRGEELTRGRDKASLLADALEAVIAAIYSDGEFGAAKQFILSALRPELEGAPDQKAIHDFKTEFQEICQRSFGLLPSYRILRESGPDHEKIFEVELVVRGQVYGVGQGRSKKEAEQRAAQEALTKLTDATAPPTHT
jgi:ribonuclease-3